MTAALRNIAIIAHVDHGKTTLVDAMLRQAGVFRENQEIAERVMDHNDQERERGITIFAKNAAIQYGGVKINIVDTPGHADFSGEVERILRMVDGCLLLVDAAEGTMPQTRFVLSKSLALGLRPVVVINKIDRPDQRVTEVEDEVLDLFISLAANDDQLEFPTIYASGREGRAATTREGFADCKDLKPLFEAIINTVPAPKCSPEGGFQLLVSNIEHSDFVGRQAVGRVERGVVRKGQSVVRLGKDGLTKNARVTRIDVFEGLNRREVESAEAGNIVILAGIDDIDIGDTVADSQVPEALARLVVAEPTVAMYFRVNDGPFAGKEGKYVTSRQIRDRLFKERLYDQALRVEETDSTDSFKVSGRGELHLSVLIEKMRREGYEFCVSRPEVLIKTDASGNKLEPVEEAIVDVPNEGAGTVIELFGRRRATLEDMVQQGDRTRMRFAVPTRGLIGFRTEFLTATKGEGILNHRFRDFGPWQGAIANRLQGVLISLEAGTSVPYGMFNLQDRGEFLIHAGVPVYVGMIVGVNSRSGDMVVNVCKEKKLTNMRASGKDENVSLTPPRKMSLESWLEFINDDEYIEVTPQTIRARKKILDHSARRTDEKKRGIESESE